MKIEDLAVQILIKRPKYVEEDFVALVPAVFRDYCGGSGLDGYLERPTFRAGNATESRATREQGRGG